MTLDELLERVDLADVYTLSFSGRRFNGEEPEAFSVVIHPQYKVIDGQIDYHFEAKCEPVAADDLVVAEVRYAVVASFAANEALDTREVPADVLRQFGSAVALFAAYPYLREGVQEMARRLHLDGLTLGLVKRSTGLPDGIRFGVLDEAFEGASSDE